MVLFGPMGGGKTAMYVRLRFGRTIADAHVALAVEAHVGGRGDAWCASRAAAAAAARALTVVDAPGTGRLRHQLLAELPNCALLVCVLDATLAARRSAP